jgi:hypothetical protein
MKAFEIGIENNEFYVSETIRLSTDRHGYFVLVGHYKVFLPNRDAATTAIPDDFGGYFIRHCGLDSRQGTPLICAPLIFTAGMSSLQIKSATHIFDDTAIVLLKSGGQNASVSGLHSGVNIISQNSGDIVFTVKPATDFEIRVGQVTARYTWTGKEFFV